MSTVVAMSPVKRGEQVAPSDPPGSTSVEFRYTQSESFVALLQQLGTSLVITTYQANKLLVARATDAGISMLVRTFDRPMGLAAASDRFALGCRDQVWEFRSAPAIAPMVDPAGQPIANAVVNVSYEHRAADEINRRVNGDWRMTARNIETNAACEFEIGTVIPGEKFTVYGRKKDRFLEPPDRKPRFTVKAGETTDLGTIKVEPDGWE